MSPPKQPPPQPPPPPVPPNPPQTRQQNKKTASPNKQRKKRNQPYPPSRELIQRQAKKDATARGFNKRRGTSTSPRNLRRQLDDTLPLDEADEFDCDHASTADNNVANPPVVVNEDEDRSTHDDALMAEANIGDLADDADNGEFDHALSENADRSNVTIADTEVDHGGMAEAHDQREAVFEGDSRVQAVTVNAPARNDDDAEMGGLINGNQKDDAVLGEEVEFDVDVDIGANSDWDSDDMSVNSTSVASVEHLKTVSTNAHTVPTNANPEDDDSGFEMGDTIMRLSSRERDGAGGSYFLLYVGQDI
eukprot:scaffold27529_cov60-Cyclotella_meneghiniana.AAC.1